MDDLAFKSALTESRNGANYFVRHWANRNFQYSDGVEAMAKAGTFWLLDIIATEACNPLRKAYGGEGGQGIVKVRSFNGEADIELSVGDDETVWKKHIDMTDMPAGEYTFVLVDEVSRFAMILMTEY